MILRAGYLTTAIPLDSLMPLAGQTTYISDLTMTGTSHLINIDRH